MRSILLVDDEVFARKGLLSLIPWQEYGYRIIGEADDGEEAFELIWKLRPDVVITDIRMPVMDGLMLIDEVQKRGGATPKFIIISGYGDFKYAQQAVRFGVSDFILKPIDEDEMAHTLLRLKDVLDKESSFGSGTPDMDATSLGKWINGSAEGESAVPTAEQLGIPDEMVCCCILVERNNASIGGGQEKERSAQEQMNRLKKAAESVGDARKPLLYDHGPSTFGMIVPFAALDGIATSWVTFADKLLRSLARENEDGSNVRIYVGAPTKGIAGLTESHRTAKEAVAYKYALDAQPLVFFDRLGAISLSYKETDAKLMAELIEQIEEADESAITSIDKVFEAFRDEQFAPESVQASVVRCVLEITRIVKELDGDENDLPSLRAMLQWSNEPRTLSGLKAMFITFAKQCVAYIADKRKHKSKGGIQKIKQYIETHYRENMSLKSISKTFYMNPVYLGQLFKKTYGVYFNDYLLEIRIQEAKRLLRQTDLKVYEIAASVGIGNPDYFVTQFEKVEHKTPTEYKNGLLNKT